MEIQCPKCGSSDLTANKKGFSGKKAVAGALLTGGVGLLAGTLGSNKVKITCLKCGHEFLPGQDRESVEAKKIDVQVLRAEMKVRNEKIRKSPIYKFFKILLLIVVAVFILILAIALIYAPSVK